MVSGGAGVFSEECAYLAQGKYPVGDVDPGVATVPDIWLAIMEKLEKA